MTRWLRPLAILGAVVLAACSESDGDVFEGREPGVGEGGGEGYEGGVDGDADIDGDVDGDWTGDTDTSGGSSGSGGAQAGTLTAGAWDDNLNFDFYLDYLGSLEEGSPPGFVIVPRTDRMVVSVRDRAGAPVAGAIVTVSDPRGGPLFSAPTGGEGTLYFFPAWYGVDPGADLAVSATLAGVRETVSAVAGDATAEVELDLAAAGVTALDVAFVIDATGSMGDEMEYIKVELDAIAASVTDRFPGLDVRWGLVVYRDEGDEYVTRSFDFTSDLAAFRRDLGAQSANGGGDYPEAVHEALRAGVALDWRAGATARVAFFVADAPHHVGRERDVAEGLLDARALGIHVYPVAASGVDAMTEHGFRAMAEVTGGRYLFLTDDSGVGGSHLEPTIPCYYVTLLANAMSRMLSIEVTGAYLEPTEDEVIRTGGDPESGRCVLESEQEVVIF